MPGPSSVTDTTSREILGVSGERVLRLVRVARVVTHLDGEDAQLLVHLRCGEAGTTRIAHGLDQVVDEALHRGTTQLVRCDGTSDFTQYGVTDLSDLT